MSAAGHLLTRLDELLEAAPPSALDADLRRVVRAHEARAAGLAQANARRKAAPPVQAAVHRAADLFLTPAYRSRVTDRSRWATDLWQWLVRGHVKVGLERQPCIETVDAALVTWREKPYGDSAAR